MLETGHDHMVISGGRRAALGEGGDSGAFVLDQSGAFVGLCFGGSEAMGISFFTAAQDLFDDIKIITGAVEVGLPD